MPRAKRQQQAAPEGQARPVEPVETTKPAAPAEPMEPMETAPPVEAPAKEPSMEPAAPSAPPPAEGKVWRRCSACLERHLAAPSSPCPRCGANTFRRG